MADVIRTLREAGVPVDQMSEGQRQSLTSLTDNEAGTLIKVHRQLAAAASEVEGQGNCYVC